MKAKMLTLNSQLEDQVRYFIFGIKLPDLPSKEVVGEKLEELGEFDAVSSLDISKTTAVAAGVTSQAAPDAAGNIYHNM